MSEIILCNISDVNSILKEKRKEWVYNVLEALGFPKEILYIDNVFDFRNILDEQGIFIENKSNDEEIDIYKRKWYKDKEIEGWLPITNKHLIAQWKKPKYIRKIEGKDVYYEIHTNEWSMVKFKK